MVDRTRLLLFGLTKLVRCPGAGGVVRSLGRAPVAAVILGSFLSGLAQTDLPLTDAERAWLTDHPVIRIGPAPNFPPVESFDGQDNYIGIAADYATILQSRLGVRFEVDRRESWDAVLEGTRQREIDVWMEAGDTAERREYMNFTRSYLTLPAVIIVRRELEGTYTLGELEGSRVAVIRGYASADFVRENYPQLELVQVPSIETGLQQVSFGSVDAVVANVAAASFYIERAGLANLRVAGESGFVWELAMAVRNDWPEAPDILQKALDSIDPGERRQIYRRWIALESTPDSWTLSEVLMGLGLLLVLIVLLGFGVWRSRSRKPHRASGQGTIAESWRVLATAAVAIALVIAAALWTDSVLSARSRLDVSRALRTVLNTTSQAVHDWFRERETETRAWAQLASVRGPGLSLSRLGPDQANAADGNAAVRAIREELEPLVAARGYDGFLLLTLDGTVLASDRTTQVATGHAVQLSEQFLQRLLESPNKAATELPRRATEPGAMAAISESILVGAGIEDDAGMVRSILAVLFDPEKDFTGILQRGRIGESGETYAINRQSQLISESRFDEDLRQIGLIGSGERSVLNLEMRDPGGNLLTGYESLLPIGSQPLTLMAEIALKGRSGANLEGYRDYRGVPVVGAWVWDDSSGLGIAVEMDVDEAYASLQGPQRRQALVATTLAVSLILGLTVLFIRNRVEMADANFRLGEAYDTIKKHKERMEEELNAAREIQMSMIPLTFPAFPERPEVSIHAALEPAREVGGDFYDFFFTEQDLLCFFLGDVSGKGVPSALFMAVTKTLIKSRATENPSTAGIMTHVNRELSSSNKESMFVTVFLALLNVRTGELVYTNAGHNPPYLKRSNGEVIRLDERHGPVVGAVEGLTYGETTRHVEPGDLVLSYTDGVTEAMDPAGRLYSEQRLRDLLSADLQSPEEAVDATVQDVWRFQADAEQADDVTVMAVALRGNNAPTKTSITLQISNRVKEIERAVTALSAASEEHGIPDGVRRDVSLVLDELLNNIISYAYDDEGEHRITLQLSISNERIAITLKDDGSEFNPLERETPETDLEIQDRPIGGLGIHLVREMMDRVSYERHGSFNVMTVEKIVRPS